MAHKGFTPIIIIILIGVLLIGAGVGGYLFIAKPGVTPPSIPVREVERLQLQANEPLLSEPSRGGAPVSKAGEETNLSILDPAKLLGLWESEKIFNRDGSENTFQQTLHIDFKEQGLTCRGHITEKGFECLQQDTYTVKGNIIDVTQPAGSGAPLRYKWKIVDGKLELAEEILFSGERWSPSFTYILIAIPYPSPKPGVDVIPPKIISLTVNKELTISTRYLDRLLRNNAPTGNEVEIICHATDETGFNRGIELLEVLYPNDDPNGPPRRLLTVTPDTSNPRDQTAIAVFNAEVYGTYTVICKVEDKAENSSKEIKTFTIP